MGHILDSLRTPEEVGFRKGYGCCDLVHCMRMVSEKSMEWGTTVWAASIDLEKAFDKIIHAAVLAGLQEAGVVEHIL